MTDNAQRSSQPGSNVNIRAVPNLRDLGGWQTRSGGSVRYGLAYRGTELDRLQGDDMAVFANLGIRAVYDLRTEAERAAQPDQIPPGSEYIVVDVLKDASSAAPAQILTALSNPKLAAEMLGGGKVLTLFEQGYRQIVSSPSALAGYRRLFSDLLAEKYRPVFFHCTTGKDRTGWAAAALLSILGVPEELVMQEYLLTNEQLLPAVQPVFDRFAADGGDPELLRPVLGVQKEYLNSAFDEMRQRFGTIEGYFSQGLGLDQAKQDALRERFVE